LLRLRQGDETIKAFYLDFRDRHGIRPTASELLHCGYNPRLLRSGFGSWFGFARSMGDLSDEQVAVLGAAGELLMEVEITRMTKSFKMLVLLAMLNLDCLPGKVPVEDLVKEIRRLASRSAALRADFAVDLDDTSALTRYLEDNPIAAWTKGENGGSTFFTYAKGELVTKFGVPEDLRGAFREMVEELTEYRLAEYLQRNGNSSAAGEGFVAKVSYTQGRPILLLPDRTQNPAVPSGWIRVVCDGEEYQANVAKIAISVLTASQGSRNILPDVLLRWFGPDAGKPGTWCRVVLSKQSDTWTMTPVGQPQGRAPELWKPYMRDQIPPLFGLQFSQAVWNAGFIAVPGHLFLLVTLGKEDLLDAHQYQDRFLSPDRFEWQSQNRTARDSRHGQLIQNHEKLGVQVHLFVRKSKRVNGKSAPFVYCGEVDFLDWNRDKPITVRWHLRSEVPERLRTSFDVS
jgi:hypothetical protein